MSEPLSLQHFAPLVGQTFEAHTAQGIVPLTLLEAKLSRPSGVGREEPFSLIFQSPKDAMLQQGMYSLAHAALSELAIFIVPIGVNEEGVQYQAIFN
jgi:hypothetical protein